MKKTACQDFSSPSVYVGGELPPKMQTIPGQIKHYEDVNFIKRMKDMWQKIKEKLNLT